jgi:hypothetical protein
MSQITSFLRGQQATSEALNAALSAATDPGLKKKVTFEVTQKTVRISSHIGVYGCGAVTREDSSLDLDTTAFFSVGARAFDGTLCYRLDASLYKRPVLAIERGIIPVNSDPLLLVIGWVRYPGMSIALAASHFESATVSSLSSNLPLALEDGYLHYDSATDTYAWLPMPATDDHKLLSSAEDKEPGTLDEKVTDTDTVTLRVNEVTRKLEARFVGEIPDADDKRLLASGSDAEPGFLNQKIANSDTIELSVNEDNKLEARFIGDIPVPIPDDHLLIASDTDTVPGTLSDKVTDTDTVRLRVNAQNKLEADFIGDFPPPTQLDHKVLANTDTDVTPGALLDKIVSTKPRYFKVESVPDAGGPGVDKLGLTLLGAPPAGTAGGDLIGSFPDPVVRQITGVPATLTKSKTLFNWRDAGSWASGAGIGYGYGYVGGVRKRCWMANSQLGELHASYDDWKSTVHAPPGDPMYTSYTDAQGKVFEYSDLTTAAGYSPRFASVTHMGLPGSASMYWVLTAQSKIYAIEDIPANYHSNGALKLESMFNITLAGAMGDPNSPCFGAGVLVFVGNNAAVYYAEAADMDWDAKVLTTHSVSSTIMDTVPDPDVSVAIGVMGGITFDGTRFVTVGRDTGVLLQSTDGKVWEILRVNSVKYQDGTSMLRKSVYEHSFALPMNTSAGNLPDWSYNDNVCWGGMTYAFNCFIVVNGKTAPTEPSQYWSPFLFSYDGVNWFAYKPTQDEMDTNYTYSCYKIAYGNHRVYATNSYPHQCLTTEPAVYRLLVDEVPFHANLLAERDLTVLGNTTLVSNAGADYLASDDDGLVLSRSLPANATVLGTNADRVIVDKSVFIPNITVSTSDPSGTPADGDIWLKIQ